MKSTVSPSANNVTWGLVLLIVGGGAAQIGQNARISAAFSLYSTGNEGGAATTIGGILALVGTIFLVSGVHQLATNVDTAARAADYAAQTLSDDEGEAAVPADTSAAVDEPVPARIPIEPQAPASRRTSGEPIVQEPLPGQKARPPVKPFQDD